MRVGGVGTARHDGAEGKAIGAVGEHKVLELVANLLLGHTSLIKPSMCWKAASVIDCAWRMSSISSAS